MKKILNYLINNRNKCTHKNALISTNEGYCPDCGEYLVKNYYIIRCARCDIKREAKIAWGEIVPSGKYCQNCGEHEFIVEKLDKINFINANYAVFLKENIYNTREIYPEVQIWAEREYQKMKQITAN